MVSGEILIRAAGWVIDSGLRFVKMSRLAAVLVALALSAGKSVPSTTLVFGRLTPMPFAQPWHMRGSSAGAASRQAYRLGELIVRLSMS